MSLDPLPSRSKAFFKHPAASGLSSYLYAAFVIIVSGGMLLVNAILCLTIYAGLPKFENEEISSRIGQMFFFVAPIVLMVVEWNLLDRMQRLFDRET